MSAAPKPPDEEERLAELRRLRILDTAAEADFDELVGLASAICGVPVSLLTLVDAERQWFKARVGFEPEQTSRDVSFCAHAILGHEVFEVPDATSDERFSANPLVVDDPRIRFYAGAPLVTSEGHALGTLCVIDRVPRTLSEEQREALRVLGKQAMAQLELRAAARALEDQNERLRELDRMKDEFVALVSHELRTPLTSVTGYIELVATGDAGPLNDEQRRFLEIAARNAGRLNLLVNDLLIVAQLESGRLSLVLDDTDVSAVAREAVEASAPAADRGGVSLAADIAPGIRLRADGARLGQALDNLLSNAVKFTPAGGSARLAVHRDGKDVVVEVADTGIGIAADDLERLFDRFYRTRDAQERVIQGTGLGLAIARGIVEGHGGTISVESVPGKGTTFSVRLPQDGS